MLPGTPEHDHLETIALRVNGTSLPPAERTDLRRFDAVLRGIALSDSPVLIRAEREDDKRRIVARLVAFGRRSDLAVRPCLSFPDAVGLIDSVLTGQTERDVAGTWALHNVSTWDAESQRALARVLEVLDACRLEERLPHERIPRVVVLEASRSAELTPELARRLGFFEISVGTQDSLRSGKRH